MDCLIRNKHQVCLVWPAVLTVSSWRKGLQNCEWEEKTRCLFLLIIIKLISSTKLILKNENKGFANKNFWECAKALFRGKLMPLIMLLILKE